jgi:tRNA wybutosine-synthesizing protein 1
MSELVNSIISGFKNIVTFGAEPVADPADNGCCGGKSQGQSACCNSESPSKETTGSGCCKGEDSASACACAQSDEPVEIDHIKIFYSTLTGTAKTFAEQLQTHLQAAQPKVNVKNISVIDIVDYDNDDFLTETAVCVFILSSYNVEGPLDW